MLASNDGDLIEQLTPLVGGGRRTALLAFREFRNAGYVPLFDRGLEFHELEYDVAASNDTLPRIRIIPIDEFDPNDFLCSAPTADAWVANADAWVVHGEAWVVHGEAWVVHGEACGSRFAVGSSRDSANQQARKA